MITIKGIISDKPEYEAEEEKETATGKKYKSKEKVILTIMSKLNKEFYEVTDFDNIEKTKNLKDGDEVEIAIYPFWNDFQKRISYNTKKLIKIPGQAEKQTTFK